MCQGAVEFVEPRTKVWRLRMADRNEAARDAASATV
jgi:hypothetical protein